MKLNYLGLIEKNIYQGTPGNYNEETRITDIYSIYSFYNYDWMYYGKSKDDI